LKNGEMSKPNCNYTGKRLPIEKEQRVINLLSLGEPIATIAKLTHSSRRTVTGIRERNGADIAQRKQMLQAAYGRLAANGVDRLNEAMDAGKLTGALLMTTTGMATDKFQNLSGDPMLTIHHQHDYTHHIDLFLDFNKAIERLPHTPKELPSGIDLQADAENSKNG
jgi:hypothetical protein